MSVGSSLCLKPGRRTSPCACGPGLHGVVLSPVFTSVSLSPTTRTCVLFCVFRLIRVKEVKLAKTNKHTQTRLLSVGFDWQLPVLCPVLGPAGRSGRVGPGREERRCVCGCWACVRFQEITCHMMVTREAEIQRTHTHVKWSFLLFEPSGLP